MAKEKTTTTTTDNEGASAESARTTRASKSRAGFTRGITQRLVDEDAVAMYEGILNSNRLDIPDHVRKRFEGAGYHVGWIRFMAGNDEDTANIFKRIEKEKFEFVAPEDVPELSLGYRRASNEMYGTMITEGDLALAKIPTKLYHARLEAKARKVARVSQGILTPLKEKGIDARNRSFVTRGQRRTDELEEEALAVLNEQQDL